MLCTVRRYCFFCLSRQRRKRRFAGPGLAVALGTGMAGGPERILLRSPHRALPAFLFRAAAANQYRRKRLTIFPWTRIRSGPKILVS
jgi:hypothetical protein